MTRIPALERSLYAAAAKLEEPTPDPVGRRWRFGGRVPARSVLLAALLLVLATGTALAGTLLVLRAASSPGRLRATFPASRRRYRARRRLRLSELVIQGAGPDWHCGSRAAAPA